jgi:GNAT superfamily N-acetyltransferase
MHYPIPSGPEVVRVVEGKSDACRAILTDLPEWFGIPEALEDYVATAQRSDMLACKSAGAIVAFMSLRKTSDAACEIVAMGVRRAFHRHGYGRALVLAAEKWATEHGCRFMHVKTLGASHPSTYYAATRRFYETVGFVPLEELNGLWPGNPCLIMVKSV